MSDDTTRSEQLPFRRVAQSRVALDDAAMPAVLPE